MKNFLLFTLLFIETINSLQAQQEAVQKRTLKSGIVIKSTPLPFLFETTVGGNMDIRQEGLSFTPLPCSGKDKGVSSIFPCNGYLVNEINLRFDDVAKVRRRNFLFLFPNRVLIRKLNGENYLFSTYRRKLVLKAYRNYKDKKS